MRRLASYYPFGLYAPFEVETRDSLVLIRHRQYWYKVFFPYPLLSKKGGNCLMTAKNMSMFGQVAINGWPLVRLNP